jgi:RluA family pseudouridine synthase
MRRGHQAPQAQGSRHPRVGERRTPIWKPGASARTVGSEAGTDLAHFIAFSAKGQLSVRAIRRALDAGACRVNGHIETFGSRKLKRGDIVEFYIPAQHQRDHDFDDKRLLHASDDIIVYDKPAGLPVTPDDAGRKWNLRDLLQKHFGGLVIAVHRLDADTSGAVIFARSEKTARRLEEAFREHQVKKTYLALVRGHPRESGEFRSYLVKQTSQKGQERWASGRGKEAREAITTWKVQERLGSFASLVEVQPRTGRYHQIRIHFSEMGHPIYGDRQYGDRQDPIHVTRHLLHAWTVEVPHPSGEGFLTFKTPFPADFSEAIKLLKKM